MMSADLSSHLPQASSSNPISPSHPRALSMPSAPPKNTLPSNRQPCPQTKCEALKRRAQPLINRPAKEGPYQERPPLCPFRLLPLLIYSGSTIASLKFQGPKSKNIDNKILLQP